MDADFFFFPVYLPWTLFWGISFAVLLLLLTFAVLLTQTMEKHELSNFMPISRRLFKHQLWCEERAFSRFEAWIYLLKEARFEDSRVYDGARLVDVKRGQIYASVRFLAQAFGWSTKRTLNFIKLLEADGMVRREIVKEIRQMRVTICNYDVYNANGNAGETPRKQQGNTGETKSNRENKEKRENKSASHGQAWRESYEVYLDELKTALDGLLHDEEFVADRGRFMPDVDIRLSMQKAYEDYWRTPEAWKRKCRQKRGIDWAKTFRNALDIRSNRVASRSGSKTSERRMDIDFERGM